MDIDATPSSDPILAGKEADLASWLSARAPVAIGFSGGVDSAYLAVAARRALGPDRVLAIIGRSPSYPEAQWAAAREVARSFDVPVLELDTAELDDPRYAANPSNRCYFCKTELWSRVVPVARERGFGTVADGTNADDLSDWRPGLAAAEAAGVHSPLLACGLGKAAVREVATALGLPNWDRPATACLASRLPYGTRVTAERLAAVAAVERHLLALGFRQVRARHLGASVSLEVEPARVAELEALARGPALRAAVRAAGFEQALVAPEGYRAGRMNAALGRITASAEEMR